MNLWQDIQPYLDKETGLLPATDGGRDNLILFSAYLIRHLNGSGLVTFETITFNFLQPASRSAPGLYRRRPDDYDDNSIDNLVGAAAVSPLIAYLILSRWSSHYTCFDVNRPDWVGFGKNTFGRFIGTKQYLKAAASESLNIFDSLLWSLICLYSYFYEKDTSNLLLRSLQVDAILQSNSWLCKKIALKWQKKNRLKRLYSEYFGPTHPLTLYAVENYL